MLVGIFLGMHVTFVIEKLKTFIIDLYRFLDIILLNLISFLFVLKGIRISVWKTKNINIGGKGLRNVSYANISDQVKFIDPIKFFQESPSELAPSMEHLERENIRKSLTNFLETYPKFKYRFSTLSFRKKEMDAGLFIEWKRCDPIRNDKRMRRSKFRTRAKCKLFL